jgi:hypothetical protein
LDHSLEGYRYNEIRMKEYEISIDISIPYKIRIKGDNESNKLGLIQA